MGSSFHNTGYQKIILPTMSLTSLPPNTASPSMMPTCMLPSVSNSKIWRIEQGCACIS